MLQYIRVLPFSNLSKRLTIFCSHKYVTMISQTIQELSCIPTNRHQWKQYQLCYTTTASLVIRRLYAFSFNCSKNLKNIRFIQTISLHLSLNITASVQLASFSSTQCMTSLMPFIDSTVHDALQHASIKRCLRSATFWTGNWYTQFYITPHI